MNGWEQPAASPTRLRRGGRILARRLGLEQQALSGYDRLLRTLEGPTARQNRRDDERVRLLAAAMLRDDSNCIDIGANEGHLLAMFVELAAGGRHIAYEPVPSLAAGLARRFPGVEVRCRAVADAPGESWFTVNKRLPSRSGLGAAGDGGESTEAIRVPVETLDSGLPSGYVPHLVKIDVEGAEHLVLRGALQTLRQHRPVIVFEHQRSTARRFGTGPRDIFGLLVEELEMRIFDLDGGGPYSLIGFERAYDTGSRFNFLASPLHGPA